MRAATLEYPDLMDPTESRYAFVAQEMFLSGNWIVPKLPWRGEIEPYLGKPPLHFWLTAASFTLFSMDEWSARLPSFLALIVMGLSIASLRRVEALQSCYLNAIFIAISSALIFFMGGTSIVDITLTACTSVAFAAFFLITQDKISPIRGGLICFIAAALGFLTKGPIALALVGIPCLAWVFFARRTDVLKSIPWLRGTALFLILVTPWFYFAERENPGFLEYFFVNENFKRFTSADYGDRYGSGHRYPFGTVWLMLIAGFLPWTIALFETVRKSGWAAIRRELSSRDPVASYFIFWGASAAVIFTFARQLHPGYILPAIPGLSILTALLLDRYPYREQGKLFLFLGVLFCIIGFGVLISGLYLGIEPGIDWLIPGFILMMLAALRELFHRRSIAVLATIAVAAYSLAISGLAQNVGESTSTESILRCIAYFSKDARPVIGLVDANNYSIYFYSRAWKGELSKPVDIRYLKSEALPQDIPSDLVLRAKFWNDIKASIPPQYTVVTSVNRWIWLRSTPDLGSGAQCPAEI